MFEINKSINDNNVVLKISGSATINFINEIKEHLIKNIPDRGQVEIDLKNITEADITFIQLLISLTKFLVKKNISFKILKNQLPLFFVELINSCGFSRNKIFS